MILFQTLMNATLTPVAMELRVLTDLIHLDVSAFQAMLVHFVSKVRANATFIMICIISLSIFKQTVSTLLQRKYTDYFYKCL